MNDEFFEKLKEKVKCFFEDGGGHGFDHVERVYNLAIKISKGEDVDLEVIKASSLLHDIARANEGNNKDICHAEEGGKMAGEILEKMNFPKDKIEKVVHCIEVHRYSKGLKGETLEAEILQDADRLEALGAIIIARVFSKVGEVGKLLYDPTTPIADKYISGKGSAGLNHLCEKSLRIKPETFKTAKAREIAYERYNYVKNFVERFKKEWEGEL